MPYQPQLGSQGDEGFNNWVDEAMQRFRERGGCENVDTRQAINEYYNHVQEQYRNFTQELADDMQRLMDADKSQETSGIESNLENWKSEGEVWSMKVIKEVKVTFGEIEHQMFTDGKDYMEKLLYRKNFLPAEKGAIILMAVDRNKGEAIYQQVMPINEYGLPAMPLDGTGNPLEDPFTRVVELD